MKVKYLAKLFYGEVVPVKVVSETDKTYTALGSTKARRKETQYESLFSTELDAKRFILKLLNRRKNKHRTAYQNAQKDLLDALVRFNLEQCEVCNEFHAVGEDHDCENYPF